MNDMDRSIADTYELLGKVKMLRVMMKFAQDAGLTLEQKALMSQRANEVLTPDAKAVVE